MLARKGLAISMLLSASKSLSATSFVTSNNTCLRYFATETENLDVNTVFTRPPFTFNSVGSGFDRKVSLYPADATTFDASTALSAWHDIPFVNTAGSTYNFVNEIPKGTRAKMEIATKVEGSPIMPDVKDGKLRAFTYGAIPFNYGAIPQTWENPSDIDADLNLGGDNDPLDVVEISPGHLSEGGVYAIKVIGVMALIDEGEVDWKVIAINAENPLARKLNDASDLENVMPGMEATIREWFRKYKTTDGKPVNTFGFDERVLSRKKAVSVIDHTHNAWADLRSGKTDKGKLWTGN